MAGAARTPAYRRRRNAWKEVIFDTRPAGSEGDSIASYRLALLEKFRQRDGYWAYLTAKDFPTEEHPLGRPLIYTVDGRDDIDPVKPFPASKLYLRDLADELLTYRVCLVDKARQMMVTTLCCLLLDWIGSFTDERDMYVSRLKEDSAIKMINDKIRAVHYRKPDWLQAACPITEVPAGVIRYKQTGSTITGVAQNFANSDARGPTPSVVLVDEAAFQDFFGEIYRALGPSAARIWAVTTANIGNPGAARFKELIEEGRERRVEEYDNDEA